MKKVLLAMACGLALAVAGAAGAATDEAPNGDVTIGLLTDMSSVYKDLSGPGSVIAAKMAIKDFGGRVLGKPIRLIVANHEDKPSLASSIARKWIDRDHVDVIVGIVSSNTGLPVQRLASSKHVITINDGAGATELTEGQCTKYGIHYVYDTHSLPAGTATAIVKNGGKTWFFITANYVFGHSLQDNTTKVVESMGGKVLGSVDAPLGTTDFSSELLQAKASGAQVIALANAGLDTVNAIKQAHEFHITQSGQQLAGLLVFINNVKALGLKTTQGLEFTSAFYWDRTPASRKWSERFFKLHHAMPTMVQAGVYSSVLTYLKAVKKAGTDNSNEVRAELGKMTINDMFVHDGHIEPNGLMLHNMYLLQVKKPSQSKGPWDLLTVVATIPGSKAFIPLSESQCPLLKH
ncbi:MAG: ABC transporter substrate-binding protein [Rhodanobacteraceae bacterium]